MKNKKTVSKENLKKLLEEGYKKSAKLDKKLIKEFEHVDREANSFLDEY